MLEINEAVLDSNLSRYISRTSPDYIVEIGCFDGFSLRRYSLHSPYSKSIGFEANPSNFFNFCVGKNIQHLAIADQVGTISLYESLLDLDNKQIRNKKTGSIFKRSDTKDFIEYIVPCNTLDNFFKVEIESEKTFVLIIDAEGATWNILKGAENFLKNTIALKVEVEIKEVWKNQKLYNDCAEMLSHLRLVGKQKNEKEINFVQTNLYFLAKNQNVRHFNDY